MSTRVNYGVASSSSCSECIYICNPETGSTKIKAQSLLPPFKGEHIAKQINIYPPQGQAFRFLEENIIYI